MQKLSIDSSISSRCPEMSQRKRVKLNSLELFNRGAALPHIHFIVICENNKCFLD